MAPYCQQTRSKPLRGIPRPHLLRLLCEPHTLGKLARPTLLFLCFSSCQSCPLKCPPQTLPPESFKANVKGCLLQAAFLIPQSRAGLPLFHLGQCSICSSLLDTPPLLTVLGPQSHPCQSGLPKDETGLCSAYACPEKAWHQRLQRNNNAKIYPSKPIRICFTECPGPKESSACSSGCLANMWNWTPAPGSASWWLTGLLEKPWAVVGKGPGLLTSHQVKALFLLGVWPHLARQQGQLHWGPVYLREIGERRMYILPSGSPRLLAPVSQSVKWA